MSNEAKDLTFIPVNDSLAVKKNFIEAMENDWGADWRVDSEIGKLRAVLMRRPGREIDDIKADPVSLSMIDTLNPEGLRAEFDALVKVYRDNGVAVHLIDDADVPVECPNIMFCHDLLNASPNGFIISRMGCNVRSKEPQAAAKVLARLGAPIAKTVNARGTFEGACLLWIDRETVILGRGGRCNMEGFLQVSGELKRQGVKTIIEVEIPNGYIHVDEYIGIADRDVAVVFPPVTPHNVYKELRKRGFRIIETPTWEEARLSANFVALEPGKIVMCEGLPKTRALLEAAGVETIEVKVDEIRKAGGAIHCLTAFLQRDSMPVYETRE